MNIKQIKEKIVYKTKRLLQWMQLEIYFCPKCGSEHIVNRGYRDGEKHQCGDCEAWW